MSDSGPGGPFGDPPTLHPDGYDAVVVGARVAGAATALHLARQGHRVAVLDRAGPPGDTTSTHALVRTGVLQLHRAGVLDRVVASGAPAIGTVDLSFGPKKISFAVEEEHGVGAYYAPRRTVLDTILLEAAAAAGAEVHLGVDVTDLTRGPAERVSGVVVRSSGGPVEVRSRLVIGADGTRSRVARTVGAPVIRRADPNNAVVYGYYTGIETPGYDFRFDAHRNVGAIPTNDGLTLVFVGGPRAEANPDGDAYLLDTLRAVAPDLAAQVSRAHRAERLRRSNGVESVLRVPAGPGWLLVGDAGFTEDPISAHGLSDALRDAELCAAAAHTTLLEPGREAGAGARYRSERDQFALRLIECAARLATFAWEPDEASRLLLQMGQIADEESAFLASRRPAHAPAA